MEKGSMSLSYSAATHDERKSNNSGNRFRSRSHERMVASGRLNQMQIAFHMLKRLAMKRMAHAFQLERAGGFMWRVGVP